MAFYGVLCLGGVASCSKAYILTHQTKGLLWDEFSIRVNAEVRIYRARIMDTRLISRTVRESVLLSTEDKCIGESLLYIPPSSMCHGLV
jgi:hypothetical protein